MTNGDFEFFRFNHINESLSGICQSLAFKNVCLMLRRIAISKIFDLLGV